MARPNSLTTRQAGIAATMVVGAVLAGVWYVWWNRSPQIGGDEAVVHSVDALFTAVTARDEKLLGQCERRLHTLKDAGKLPDAAADYIDGIIKSARAGRWQAAAERLYGFIKDQKRDGAHSAREGVRHPVRATSQVHERRAGKA